MRELVIVTDRSDHTRLVLQPVGEDTAAEEYVLPVTNDLRRLIASTDETVTSPATTPASAPVDEVRPSRASDPLPASSKSSTGPDPRLSKPLPMTPREIQDEIRRGATVQDIADKCDLPESRITPFAYPVLQERARIAELAKSSRPMRSDGPCPLTLAELTATALSAQGEDVAAARWDARRNHANQWVIVVTYGADKDKTATWTLVKNGGSHTTVPADQAAQAITEPDHRPSSDVEPEVDEDTPADEPADTGREPAPRSEAYGQDVLIPELEGSGEPRRRRRKAETPHWEDVLLSVRSSTKRPRT